MQENKSHFQTTDKDNVELLLPIEADECTSDQVNSLRFEVKLISMLALQFINPFHDKEIVISMKFLSMDDLFIKFAAVLCSINPMKAGESFKVCVQLIYCL